MSKPKKETQFEKVSRAAEKAAFILNRISIHPYGYFYEYELVKHEDEMNDPQNRKYKNLNQVMLELLGGENG